LCKTVVFVAKFISKIFLVFRFEANTIIVRIRIPENYSIPGAETVAEIEYKHPHKKELLSDPEFMPFFAENF